MGGEPARVYLQGVARASAPAFAHIAACPPLNERRSLLVDFLGFGYSDKFRRLCALLGFTVLVRGSNEDCYVERKNRSRPKSSRKGSVFDHECQDLARPVATIGTDDTHIAIHSDGCFGLTSLCRFKYHIHRQRSS